MHMIISELDGSIKRRAADDVQCRCGQVVEERNLVNTPTSATKASLV